MLFRETVTVYCENHTKRTNAHGGQQMVHRVTTVFERVTHTRVYFEKICLIRSLAGACIATGYGLDDRAVGVGVPVG
jgi:hypothetical protein